MNNWTAPSAFQKTNNGYPVSENVEIKKLYEAEVSDSSLGFIVHFSTGVFLYTSLKYDVDSLSSC